MIQKNSVMEQVVSQGFCIGCGICTAGCPTKNIKIKFDGLGEYKAVGTGQCRENCSICTSVCPRIPGNDNEDVIAKMRFGNVAGICHTAETGYYLSCYSGFSKDKTFRNRAASGGLTTLFLEQLLKREMVDGVICVKPGRFSGKLFEFFIARTADDLRSAASSAYYPVEFSQVIQEIKKTGGRYAVVGLPCFITGLSLAQDVIPSLKKAVKFKVGLVCGAMLNTSYLKEVFRRSGIHPGSVKSVKFRDTSLFPNRLRGLNIRTKNGHIFHSNYAMEGRMHRSLISVPTACLFCDDVFAETADIAFMDAWLPSHQKDHFGTTLALVRHPACKDIMETMKTEETSHTRKAHISHIIQSQHPRLTNKRIFLNYRLKLAKQWSIPFPEKRNFTTPLPTALEKATIRARFYRQQKIRGLSIHPWTWLTLLPSRIFEWMTELKLSLKDSIRVHYFNHCYGKKRIPDPSIVPRTKEML